VGVASSTSIWPAASRSKCQVSVLSLTWVEKIVYFAVSAWRLTVRFGSSSLRSSVSPPPSLRSKIIASALVAAVTRVPSSEAATRQQSELLGAGATACCAPSVTNGVRMLTGYGATQVGAGSPAVGQPRLRAVDWSQPALRSTVEKRTSPIRPLK